MKCRVDGCAHDARWQAVVIMAPPGKAAAPPIGFPSPLVCCDKHKPKMRAVDALGPNGMELLEAAFGVLGKQPPAADDLGLDWMAYDGRPLTFKPISEVARDPDPQ